MKLSPLRRPGFWILLLLVACAATLAARLFLHPRERLAVVRIAAGRPGGTYQRFIDLFAKELRKETKATIRVVETRGSVENEAMLLSGSADLAMLQLNDTVAPEIVAVAPVYDELLFIIQRKGFTFPGAGRIAAGEPRSGSLAESLRVLQFFGISGTDQIAEVHFSSILTDPSIQCAIETTGLLNPALQRLLASGSFTLRNLPEAEAISTRLPYTYSRDIPMAAFCGNPPVPETAIRTVALKAFIGSRKEAPDWLIRACHRALEHPELSFAFPTIDSRQEGAAWTQARWHPESARYYNPYANIDFISNILQGVDAVKELLVAIGALVYLGWSRLQKLQKRKELERLAELKERLDAYLRDTIEIERAQMQETDPARLKQWLDKLTEIKLDALHEFTEDDLRGDRNFSIFLQQTAIVSDKLQRKIIVARSEENRLDSKSID